MSLHCEHYETNFKQSSLTRKKSFTRKEVWFYLGCIWIFDLSGWQKVPVTVDAARVFFLVVHKNTVAGIRFDDECIYMCKLVCFTIQGFLDLMVLSFVMEYSMDLVCADATNIRPKHYTANKNKGLSAT